MQKYTGVQSQIVKNVQKLNHLDRRNWQVAEKYFDCVQKALPGCLHFISEEFGSAFCYDGTNGYIMTCAHCVVDDSDQDNETNINQDNHTIQEKEPIQKKRGRPKKKPQPQQQQAIKEKRTFNLIFANGEEVECRVVKFNLKLDIAVLQIIKRDKIFDKVYPQVEIMLEGDMKKCEELVCIGQPAYHDMESVKEGKTNYPPFYMSNGYFEGYTLDPIYGVKEKGLGPLKHSCWTYWGHSGSPLLNLQGKVIGIHNSWNDQNCMRHGISILSIREFQKQYPDLFVTQNKENQTDTKGFSQ